MRGPQALGNDELDRLTNRLGSRVAEQRPRRLVPLSDDAVVVRDDDGVGRTVNHLPRPVMRVDVPGLHGSHDNLRLGRHSRTLAAERVVPGGTSRN